MDGFLYIFELTDEGFQEEGRWEYVDPPVEE